MMQISEMKRQQRLGPEIVPGLRARLSRRGLLPLLSAFGASVSLPKPREVEAAAPDLGPGSVNVEAAAEGVQSAAMCEIFEHVYASSHNVRNFASTTAGLIDLVLERTQLSVEDREYLRVAREVAVKAVNVAHHLNGVAAEAAFGPTWLEAVPDYMRNVYGLPER